MSNTRKIRLIIDKTKMANKHAGRGCNCGKSGQIVQTNKIENNKVEEIKKDSINNNNKLKFL